MQAVMMLPALLALAVPQATERLPPAASAQVVDALADGLRGYVDPDQGRQLAAAVGRERGRLTRIRDRVALVATINALLAANSKDLHLKARIDTTETGAPSLSEAQEAALERHLAHGLMAVRRLPGNVGYLKLRYFAADAAGAAMIDRAMTMLAACDTLIIDLRENTGGGGAADARLLGYLAAQPIPMARIEWREADGRMRIEQCSADVAPTGPLWPGKPLYVLTARRTFSAAEALAYDLKAAGRATLIGERTRGGANPSNRQVQLGYGISAFIPNGRVVHPTTGSNWEGVGVEPDIATPSQDALVVAYGEAIRASRPIVETAKSRDERARAMADPRATLLTDAGL